MLLVVAFRKGVSGMTGSEREVIEYLSTKRHILISSHEKPDGDALGASLALARILAASGRRASLVGYEPLAGRYRFLLNPDEMLPVGELAPADAEVLISLDSGDLLRNGKEVGPLIGVLPVVNIDHHQTNSLFGLVNWVDPNASSAGEMVYRLAQSWGLPIPPEAAAPLWVAISTDTGDFTYSNTTGAVLRIAADLIDLGVQPHLIRRELHEQMEPRELALMGRCLERLAVHHSGKISYICLTREDFTEFHCSPQDLHDPINLARSVAGVMIAVVVYELPEENRVKVSLRTYAPYNAAEFCQNYGGGGHARAAGFSVDGTPASEVLEEVLAGLEVFLN